MCDARVTLSYMSNREQTSVRLNKTDHARLRLLKKAMVRNGTPEAEITLSMIMRYAIERAAMSEEQK